MMMEFKNIFVTVGTTQFKKLIDKIQEQNIVEILKKLKCEQLVIQAGSYELESFNHELFEASKINVKIYQYADNLREDMSKADLIIGHAGAGTCLEGLRMEKKMIVVINEDLMHNHQAELASKLGEKNYVKQCVIDTLEESLKNIQEAFVCVSYMCVVYSPAVLEFIQNLFVLKRLSLKNML